MSVCDVGFGPSAAPLAGRDTMATGLAAAKVDETLRRSTGIDLECLRLRFPVLRKRLLLVLAFGMVDA